MTSLDTWYVLLNSIMSFKWATPMFAGFMSPHVSLSPSGHSLPSSCASPTNERRLERGDGRELESRLT